MVRRVTPEKVQSQRQIFFSLFMFTADLMPNDRDYTAVLVRHIRELRSLGYDGFDLPIPARAALDAEAELASYVGLRRAFEDAGLGDVTYSTNVAATLTFDPTSPHREQREAARAYLRSRVDITAALGGSLLAGPLIFPYNVYYTTDEGQPLWSDALQDFVRPGYERAVAVLDAIGEYAAERDVDISIEPVDHWEQAAPNTVGDVADFLDKIRSPRVGVCIDSSHVVLGSEGPDEFLRQVTRLAPGRVSAIHVSAPDRGQLADSWIPWHSFLAPLLPLYDGALLVEVFNAIPPFVNSFRLTRRKFWIPGEDEPVPGVPHAYTVAGEAIERLRSELARIGEAAAPGSTSR